MAIGTKWLATPKAATTSCGGGYSTGPGSSATNTLYGDAYSMSGHARGGDDQLYGGGSALGSSSTNTLYGDAYSMSGNARGGDDRLYGGGTAAPGGAITNSLYGDAYSMSGNAQGGDDQLYGGSISGEYTSDIPPRENVVCRSGLE